MDRLTSLSRAVVELIVLGSIVLAVFFSIQLVAPAGPGSPGASQGNGNPPPAMTLTAAAKATAHPGPATDITDQKTLGVESPPYPAPVTEAPSPEPQQPDLTPSGTVDQLPENPPLPVGQAATLHDADIWLVEPGVQPKRLTDFGDVFLIFDWNREGTKLVFGRDSTEQAWGYSTELWLLDLTTGKSRQLTKSGLVRSARWSPVDDRLAYCEYGNLLTVIDAAGSVLHTRDQALCMFTWSPDGEAIALATYTPEMVDADGLAFAVLGVWWLADDNVQTFSSAKDEVHSSPVWSMDGQRLLFIRGIFDISEADPADQGLYLADVSTGRIERVLASPDQAVLGLMRSPQADLVLYRLGTEIYIMDFDGNAELIGQGQPGEYPNWLPDGKSILIRAEKGALEVITSDAPARGLAVGGWLPALQHLEYYTRPGDDR